MQAESPGVHEHPAAIIAPQAGELADGKLRLAEDSSLRKDLGSRAVKVARTRCSRAAHREALAEFWAQLENGLGTGALARDV